ncbi:MAG: AsmA family protein [Proteobacteria bacterium]|nr:AsmA family protein [Pseudomonadota bacterium]
MAIRLPLPDGIRARLRLLAIAAFVLLLVITGMAAAFIVTRDYDAMERQFVARLEKASGGRLTYASSRRILWLKPKLALSDIRFSDATGSFALSAEQAIIRFDLADLADGTIDRPNLTLVSPHLTGASPPLLDAFSSPRHLAGLVSAASGLFATQSQFATLRAAVQNGTMSLEGAGPGGEVLELSAIDGALRFTGKTGRIEIEARAAGAPRPLEIAVSLPSIGMLRDGAPRSASLQLSAGETRLNFAGTARLMPDLSLSGRLEIAADPAFEAAFLGTLPRKRENARDMLQLSAATLFDERGINLENLRIARGGRQLVGIAALRPGNGRWALSATIAGDLVDGSAAQAALQRLRGPGDAWSEKPLAVSPLPGIDLDIRLSTQEFKLGNVRFSNVALSILTRPGRTELAIIDARFGEGMIKARVSVTEAGGMQELRLQANGDKLDGGRFFDRALGFSRITGSTTFAVQAESRGASIKALVANLAGSGALDIRDGELVGIDLQKLLARSGSDSRPEAALLFSLAGKTPFEAMRINVAIRGGQIEPVGSQFLSAKVSAGIEGAIDLAGRQHKAVLFLRRRAEESANRGEFFAFRLEGPLFSPSLKPDLSLLANRS